MTTTLRVAFATCLVSMCSLAWCMPLRLLQSPKAIRASLLVETPKGSSIEFVRSALAKKGLVANFQNGGYVEQEPGHAPRTVGVIAIRSSLGDFNFPLDTNVTAFWGFDAAGHLLDIWVWKTADAP